MNTDEFIEQILLKINGIIEATGLSKAVLVIEVVQMIDTLKKGISDQNEAHKQEKDALLKQIDDLNKQLLGDIPDGDETIGGQTYHIHLGPKTEEVKDHGNE